MPVLSTRRPNEPWCPRRSSPRSGTATIPQGRRLRRVGPPALRPGSGLRRPGLLALDLGTPGSPDGGPPMAHQRPPDRARLVQVVRPAVIRGCLGCRSYVFNETTPL